MVGPGLGPVGFQQEGVSVRETCLNGGTGLRLVVVGRVRGRRCASGGGEACGHEQHEVPGGCVIEATVR